MSEDLPERFGIEAQSPYLKQPITTKHTLVAKGKLAAKESKWALSSMQGWRVTMEDAHAHALPIRSNPNVAFFGIFDGHGGDVAANYAAANVLSFIENSDAYQEHMSSGSKDPDALATALAKGSLEGFIECDEAMKELDDMASGRDYSGSTGICCFITEHHVVFANAGDSRGALFSNNRVKFATKDQKPSDALETARVKAAGGMVSDNRVNGDLASARSFGDFRYKLDENLPPSKQIITVMPATTIVPRSGEDQFVMLACDGIWDVMSNFEATQLAQAAMRLGCGLGTACEYVLEECLLKSSGDNMSVELITLANPAKELGKAKPGKEPSLDQVRDHMVNTVI